ncbi:cob(I)yrinic acid a,c-diamide adenosyltransferase [Candidatus Woesearchaeota archaeon]|nr:cob(I)yrinic acid a,c-diamide adenosyltransferase [Candidatus Woesearchaeota archaeon]
MGYSYLFTGGGGGKTTNALGLAMRSVGHKNNVVVVQFLKWWKSTGEYKVARRLKPHYEIHQFGRPGWFRVDGGKSKTYKFGKKEFHVKSLDELDRHLAKEALDFAKETLQKKPNLLILDEINLVLHWKLLNVSEVIELMDNAPRGTDIVLTGRYAPKKLIERADFVNEIREIKSPKKIPMTKGIQY